MFYDQFGNPIKTTQLKTEQATITPIRNITNWHTIRQITPQKLAAILRNGADGDLGEISSLCDEMLEKDTHLLGDWMKRVNAVSGLSWSVAPYDQNDPTQVEVAEFVQQTLDSLDIDIIIAAMMDSALRGIAACEIMWEFGNRWRITEIAPRPLQWFQYPYQGTELHLRSGNFEGEKLIPGKWLIHRHYTHTINPYRRGLMRPLAWLYLLRNYDLMAWAQFIESYGIPWRLGRYPQGSQEADKETLLKALQSIAADAAVAIPEGMLVDIIESKGTNSDAHERFMRWSDSAISHLILGGTLTSQTEQNGNRALGEVHDSVRAEIRNSDARQISRAINRQVIKTLVELNFGNVPLPTFSFKISRPKDSEKEARTLQILSDSGFKQVPLWYIHETFGIPTPQEGDLTLADITPEPTNPLAALGINRQQNRMTPAATAGQAVVDAEAEKSTEGAPQPIDGGAIRQAIKQARDPQDLEVRLANLIGKQNPNFTETLARAQFAAEILGYIHASENQQ